PSFDSGELDYAFGLLAQTAIVGHQYDRAAYFRRLQAGRAAMSENSDALAVYLLFALHARYGPLAGFDNDLRHFSAYLSQPAILYALSNAYARNGWTIESLACEQAARSVSLTCASRMMTSLFLANAGCIDPARREAELTLLVNDPDTAVFRLEARLALARWATDENEDATVQHLSAAIDLIHQIPADGLRVEQSGRIVEIHDVAADLAWHSARIAMNQAHDPAAVKKHLDELMQLSPNDPEIVQNSYSLFKSAGRADDADKLFSNAYMQAHAELAQNPDDPVLMNQLAWLCARCDQKMPEAFDMASKAAAAEPDSAAILDTFAEVNFRMGHTDEAVKLETRALQIEPDDVFMNKQLKRFSSGKRN
ncbi:MAG TPA: hypothetical protein VKK61_10520, partial [Tepidisphaeraceae bacterium]|nr:hypothetical protein [Tepidisphaeraceae bacterium]